MPNIVLTVAYDGTNYLGWQKTSEGPSVEETLGYYLNQILQEPLQLQAASRTDAGVHADNQIVNFISHKDSINLDRLQLSLNQLLPPDIVVTAIQIAFDNFHPTLAAASKEYHYRIFTGTYQLPLTRFDSWHCYYPLNLEAMEKASTHFLGSHDFSAFCNVLKNREYEHLNRTIQSLEIIKESDQMVRIVIKGNNFLYKMVRNIVGTLIFVGRGKILPEQVPLILASGDRTQAGMTAPAHGLRLYKVYY
jgi:tRNA pseudouridine38-40 synthase